MLNLTQVEAQPARSVLKSIEKETVSLVKQVEPSIVSVIAQRRVINRLNGESYSSWDSAIGSGVVIHPDGYILTTWNVVDQADQIIVSFPDGQHRQGSLVGLDPLSGVGVIHVDSVTAIPAQLGDSDEVYPGSWAIMMGNAYGLPSSVSIGLINGIRVEDGLLQVSALVNPGATGGAVFSTEAKLIGLITAELAPAQESVRASYNDGVSINNSTQFSSPSAMLVIPINRVKAFVDQLIKHGEVRRSWLGVVVEQSWMSINMGSNLINLVEPNEGLTITRIVPGSPADEAGLRIGDHIISVNDNPMTHLLRLAEYVTSVPIGSEIEIRYSRENQEAITHARLVQWPQQPDSSGESTMLTDIPADGLPIEQQPLLPINKTINQWLMELQMEIQRLKQEHMEEQHPLEKH